MEISEKELVCRMLELAYNKQNGITDSKDMDSIYPFGWFLSENYSKKIEILNEAIKNSILIINTESYQDIIEGVRYE